MAADNEVYEGHSSTITFSGWTPQVISIEIGAAERETIETTDLDDTSWKTYVPAALANPGTVTVVVHHTGDSEADITGAAGTLTVTKPIPSGGASGATEASTAHLISWQAGTFATDQRVESTAVFQRSSTVTYTDSA